MNYIDGLLQYLNNCENIKIFIDENAVKKYVGEFWTNKQRSGNSIHEISYRACYKPQLPNFFIHSLTSVGDYVYDPFAGRGTTAIESALLGRNVISNDINVLSKILTEPRLQIPNLNNLRNHLNEIKFTNDNDNSKIDLSMFYHEKTEQELLSLRKYILNRELNDDLNICDKWIRMVATNRLTGHSNGFFSVYTLPPNQAVTQEKQIALNKIRNQKPEYRDIKNLILKKSESLLKDISENDISNLQNIYNSSHFITSDARNTYEIPNETIQLTVTSPPFLNVVQYSKDNWLRCWFNGINVENIEKRITMSKNINDWCNVMQSVFDELFRITKSGGFVAFEVGDINKGKIKLDDYVVPLGKNSGFKLIGVLINEQKFTKTSNIWGIKNNESGINSNKIVMFQKY